MEPPSESNRREPVQRLSPANSARAAKGRGTRHMTHTWLTDRFGLTVPIIGAPMAGPAGGRLASAVSAAGALGMVGVGGARQEPWIREQAAIAAGGASEGAVSEGDAANAQNGGQPFGIGLMAWVLDQDDSQLTTVLQVQPSLVSVSFGNFEPHVRRLVEADIPVTVQVGNVEEALRAEHAGVDFIVARGAEAGGHGRNDVATLPLLQAILGAVKVPVVAAGGITTSRGLAAVLAAGAAGAWVGTALLTALEAANSPRARAQLIAAGYDDTAYGRVFDVAQRLGWPPEYGGRSLRNSFFNTWHDRLDELAVDESAAAQFIAAREAEDYDVAYLYAGQGVGSLTEEKPAAEIIAELAGAK